MAHAFHVIYHLEYRREEDQIFDIREGSADLNLFNMKEYCKYPKSFTIQQMLCTTKL